ncbi:CpG-binding protein [Fasciola gigantica]|uniref:CpG-binding protein n=1 Tax=Fasciola gigantica TaxID=46835 RepID=A0A504Y7N0_FASGI|nr:CpG-binding protein [Fasciola gigantica]
MLLSLSRDYLVVTLNAPYLSLESALCQRSNAHHRARSIGSTNSSRNKDSVSGVFPLPSGDGIDFLDDDSDDDLVISGPPHCAGPTCISAPLPGEKYCSEACRVKHANSRGNLRPTPPRLGAVVHDAVIPYNLPYPDHMYCRHHRVYNWHTNNGTIPSINAPPSYRAMNSSFDPHFAVEAPYMSPDTMRPSRGGHSSYAYNSGSIHPLSQHLPITSPGLTAVSNARLPSALDEHHHHSVICDANDTNAFIIDSSMTSAMHHRGGVVPLVEDLDLDLGPQHHASTGSTRLSPSPGLVGVSSCYGSRTASDSTRRHMVHHPVHRPDDREGDGVVDGLTSGDVDEDGLGESHGPNHHHHPVYGYHYMMMAYQNDEATNGHSNSRSQSLDGPSGDRRDRSLNHHHPHHRLLLMPDGSEADSVNGLGSPVRGLSLSSGAPVRHSPLTGASSAATAGISVRPDGVSAIVASTANAVTPITSSTMATPQPSISAFLPGPDEFYTINDSDDLEINWPQETVSGVNG